MNNVLPELDKSDSVKIGDKLICWQTGVVLSLPQDPQPDLQPDLQQEPQPAFKLEPRPLEFLHYLAQHPGQLVSREQLLEQVWGKRHVSDDAIRGVVKKLREALGDNAKSPSYIKTVPLKGYILIARISEPNGTKDPLNIEAQSEINITDNKPVLNFSAASICIGLALVLLGWLSAVYFIANDPAHKPLALVGPTIEPLTHLSGGEVDGDYSEALQTLVFSYQGHEDQDSWTPPHHGYDVVSLF